MRSAASSTSAATHLHIHTETDRHGMRARSLTAVGSTAGALAKDIASQVRALRPDALLWLTDSARPEEVASALSDTCGASAGGVRCRASSAAAVSTAARLNHHRES